MWIGDWYDFYIVEKESETEEDASLIEVVWGDFNLSLDQSKNNDQKEKNCRVYFTFRISFGIFISYFLWIYGEKSFIPKSYKP